jgi:hypothetical protein
MILDNLIEKKDIATYIKARIAYLKIQMLKAKNFPDRKKRHLIAYGMLKRIKELEFLRKILSQRIRQPLKEYTINNWDLVE